MTSNASTSTLEKHAQAAWTPVVALAYGALATSALGFLGAGFHRVHALLHALGSFSGSAMAPAAGMFVTLVLSTALSVPLAKSRLGHVTSTTAIVQHLIWILAAATLLSFPPAQWLTFGRPDLSSPVASVSSDAVPPAKSGTMTMPMPKPKVKAAADG